MPQGILRHGFGPIRAWIAMLLLFAGVAQAVHCFAEECAPRECASMEADCGICEESGHDERTSPTPQSPTAPLLQPAPLPQWLTATTDYRTMAPDGATGAHPADPLASIRLNC